MNPIPLQVLTSFSFQRETPSVFPINNGLINSTYIVSEKDGKTLIVQRINQTVFPYPERIVHNYLKIADFLHAGGNKIIPAPIQTSAQNYFVRISNSEYWRAFEYIANSKTISIVQNEQQAAAAATCFAALTKKLAHFSTAELITILPDFHNLSIRFAQFELALKKASPIRKENAKNEIEIIFSKKALVHFFENLKSSPSFRLRIMHHDAKLSNILFQKKTDAAICPIDFDTLQAGYFFSDLGDMIRSMTSTVSEDSNQFESLNFRESIYEALVSNYTAVLKDELTSTEIDSIHYAGRLMIYMQAIRFLTDYLSGDIYYHTTFSEQNLIRTKNQLLLLKKLDTYLSMHNLL